MVPIAIEIWHTGCAQSVRGFAAKTQKEETEEMQRLKTILVTTDTRWEDHPIVDEAAEIARHNGASLKIVDVVPEFSSTVRLTLKNHQLRRR